MEKPKQERIAIMERLGASFPMSIERYAYSDYVHKDEIELANSFFVKFWISSVSELIRYTVPNGLLKALEKDKDGKAFQFELITDSNPLELYTKKVLEVPEFELINPSSSQE